MKIFKYLLLSLLLCSNAFAATITSNGTGGGNFTTGATWSGGTEPADGDETAPLQKITVATAVVTVQGTPALGDLVHCRISRDADTDTSVLDAWLMGVRIEYGKNANASTAW